MVSDGGPKGWSRPCVTWQFQTGGSWGCRLLLYNREQRVSTHSATKWGLTNCPHKTRRQRNPALRWLLLKTADCRRGVGRFMQIFTFFSFSAAPHPRQRNIPSGHRSLSSRLTSQLHDSIQHSLSTVRVINQTGWQLSRAPSRDVYANQPWMRFNSSRNFVCQSNSTVFLVSESSSVTCTRSAQTYSNTADWGEKNILGYIH